VRGPYVSPPLDAIRNKLGVRAGADCDAAGAKCVYHADSGQAAIDAAAKADVAIVFVYTTSSEGSDRANLNLQGGGDQLVNDVFHANPKTVVVAVTPGALLTNWDVPAIFASIMPGQEYGNAITDLLFGDVNPSARLPVTFPNVENEVRFTADQYPGTNGVATYSERLQVGYRWYDANKVTPHFAFGHGLSYTTFAYSSLTVSNRSITCTVRNSGSRAGAEVAQLYLGFPSAAGEPPQQLKGFQKIQLAAGASGLVTFPLDSRSFSIWNAQTHAWNVVNGQFQVSVGSSSREIHLSGVLAV
jgi:beta-glucosidase